MPDDNPYAAPQTLEPQFATDEQLPIATLTGRQHYPEIETGVLLRLAELSRAIERATVLWMFPLLGSFGPSVIYVLFGNFTWGWSLFLILTVSVCVFRLYAGAARRKDDRIVIAALDGMFLTALFACSVAVIGEFRRDPELHHVFTLLVLGLLAVVFVGSIRATFSAQALFGPTPFVHRELIEEADYRREQQIP